MTAPALLTAPFGVVAVAGAAAWLLVAPPLAAQPSFTSRVHLVTVPVTITADRRPLPRTSLTAGDLRLFEDGVEQQIAVFARERLPHSVCVVTDASGSMSGMRQRHAAAAVQRVVNQLERDDEFAVIVFNGAPAVAVPWTAAARRDGVRWDLGAEGFTSLTDAMNGALRLMDSASNPRRVVLLVTDGFENASKYSLSRVVGSRQQSEITVHAFVMTSPADVAPSLGALEQTPPSRVAALIPERDPDVVASLVGDSGGRIFRIGTPGETETAPGELLQEFRAQLSVGYTPTRAFDGKYRKLKVETKARGVTLRHRGGYLAMPGAATP